MACGCIEDKEKLYNSGVLVEHCEGAVLPPAEEWKKKRGGYVIVECPQRIPCNPCATVCPSGAIVPHADINDTPEIDYAKSAWRAVPGWPALSPTLHILMRAPFSNCHMSCFLFPAKEKL